MRPVTLVGSIIIQRSRGGGAHGWTASLVPGRRLGSVGYIPQPAADYDAPTGFRHVIRVVGLERDNRAVACAGQAGDSAAVRNTTRASMTPAFTGKTKTSSP